MSDTSVHAPAFPISSHWSKLVGLVGMLVAAALLPFVVHGQYPIFIATQVGIYVLIASGLNILSGYGGMPSLGHGAIMAIGAYTTAILMVDHQWSFWLAATAGILAAALVGALMAVPALRLSSWYFALITLGFAEVTSNMLVEWEGLTHAFNGIVNIPMPQVGSFAFEDRHLFWLVIALNVVCFVLCARLARSRFGRGLIAVRDNPEAAIASGVSLPRIKLLAFVFSAVLAGLGGALFAVQKAVITPHDFTSEVSIFFLVVVVLGGSGTVWGPIVGSLCFFAFPELLERLESWRLLVYGILLLLLMMAAPGGIVGVISQLWRRWVGRRPGAANERSFAGGNAALVALRQPEGGSTACDITIDGVEKMFGGVAALRGIDLRVGGNTMHAIVGPNGSGKTTLLNLISGYYPVNKGRIEIGSREITGLSPVSVARLGIGRTFQTPRLLPDLTAIENVMLGGFAAERASLAEIGLALPRAKQEHRALVDQATGLLEFVNVGGVAHVPAGELTHGQQRLVEIARALIGKPHVLLFDEPAAGLLPHEIDRLGELIRAIRQSGTTVVMVEHHLDFVGSLCEQVTVLNRGSILASGAPSDIFTNEDVIRAYVGAKPLKLDH